MKKYLITLSLFTFLAHALPPVACNGLMENVELAKKLVEKDPILLAKSQHLLMLMSKGTQDQAQLEKEFFDIAFELEKKGDLKNSLGYMVTVLKEKKVAAILEKMDSNVLTEQLYQIFRSEFTARGYVGNAKFASWETIASQQMQRMEKLPHVENFIGDEFRQVFKTITGSEMHTFKNLTFLATAELAMKTRVQLIKEAKHKIHMMTWGFYDDEIGKTIADELIAAKKSGVEDIKIMVDAQTASRPGYNKELKRLEENGIQVVYWKGKENPFYGMHMKMMIVDDNKVIEGGRNIGVDYLKAAQWEDMEVLYEGGALAEWENPNHFARYWNDQIDQQKLSFSPIELKPKGEVHGTGTLATVIHAPKVGAPDEIYEFTLYSTLHAKREIYISNAYYISTPAMQKAIDDAIARGVKVHLYTNSSDSVDEVIVSLPIMKSAKHMAEQGAEVFLKQGKTLHTKGFIADDVGWIGSYNDHPRSLRYENEKITVFNDPESIRKFKGIFNENTSHAMKITDPSVLKLPDSPSINMLFGMIFNQL